MKTAIIFADGIKQIMFTPENNEEKEALKMITSDDNIELAIKTGTIYDGPRGSRSPYGGSVQLSRGGYLRIFDGDDSLMLVLTPKKIESQAKEPVAKYGGVDFIPVFKWLCGETVPDFPPFMPDADSGDYIGPEHDRRARPYWWRSPLRTLLKDKFNIEL